MCVICFVLCRVMSFFDTCVKLCHVDTTQQIWIFYHQVIHFEINFFGRFHFRLRPGISNLLCVRDGILTSVMT